MADQDSPQKPVEKQVRDDLDAATARAFVASVHLAAAAPHLAAAAPELLAALRDIVALAGAHVSGVVRARCYAAIAKAEGTTR